MRRNPRTGEVAFYRTWTPQQVPLAELVRVAGRRWIVEETFQTGRGLTGLDEHQVRTWTSWRRWTVLAMLAHAFLTVTAASTIDPETGPHQHLRLTRNELQRLLTALTAAPVQRIRDVLHWSTWRRRHTAIARASHYRRQAAALT